MAEKSEPTLPSDPTPDPPDASPTDLEGTVFATSPLHETAEPKHIGPYKVVRKIGEGGMGAVYLAEQVEPVRRPVALKIIKLGMDTKEVVARFEAERQALAIMNHRSIARVFDAGVSEPGRPYFVLEFVAGVPLNEYCDRHRLSTEERLHLFTQVCDAVHHAHQKAVIHRDLKPSNILVMTEDEKPLPKIIDFGIAKATNQRLTEHTLYTRHGQIVGTPEYMSPEQAEMTAEDIDIRTDIYSLGVILYELLVGQLPFDPSTLREGGYVEMQRIIREVEPAKPSTRLSRTGDSTVMASKRRSEPGKLLRALRGELDWITMKALDKDRTRRYASASEFAADIRRFLDHEPVLAGPPSTVYRLRKFVDKHRGLVTAAAIVVIALTVGLVTNTLLWWRAKENEETALLQEERARRALDRVLRLADIKLIQEYRREADDLWPARPEQAPAMREWLGRARALVARRPAHEAALAELRQSAIDPRGTVGADGSVTYRFGDAETRWRHDVLAELVDALQRFGDPETGAVAEVERRLDFALAVQKLSLDDARDRWEEARASVSNRAECPAYQGLDLPPQLGLVPIGRDPDSGLWEFAHIESGKIPRRDSSGRLMHDGETGLVFVLVPGGSFYMGSEASFAKRREAPVHEVTLAPFLISKFEMTQGQWRRVTGHNPSRYRRSGADPESSWRHPVEQVSWEDCARVLGRLALELPTEAQWEYASRAGTTTPWWTGDEKESIRGAGNVLDLACKKDGGPSYWIYEEWLDDGYSEHAPVGSYRANAFGLHDTIGNVWEWCRDSGDYESDPIAAGDGERRRSPRARMLRGGAFFRPALSARSAHRREADVKLRGSNVGVRPSTRIDSSVTR